MQKKRTVEDRDYSLKPFDDTKTIFIHIPKTAGISISTSLYSCIAAGHKGMSHYQYVFSKKDFDNYFKFTFVRNPWDRLFSAYTYLKKGGRAREDRIFSSEHLSHIDSFEQFVMEWLTEKNIQKGIHFIPQTDMLFLPGTSIIPVDFLGFFENIEEDFQFVAKKMNKTVAMQHLNASSSKHAEYKNHYTQAMINIAATVYQADIDALGYSFDNSTLDKQLAMRSEGLLTKPA